MNSAPGATRLGRPRYNKLRVRCLRSTRYSKLRVRCLHPRRYNRLRVGPNPFGDTRFRKANAEENAND